ncbi:MAG: RHS repeat-associated core domain-containing protein [Chloroflexi bacterium]|nr:RHS repeat-associated core domain-containing protein [Chloroflexota bacterium]
MPPRAARPGRGRRGPDLDETLYYCHDANMNVTALVNTSGTVVERVVYDPYGRPKFYDGSWANPSDTSAYANEILYCGYRFDPESGLYHVRHRSYHPTLGRWGGRDPSGYVDSMNMLEYCIGAPVSKRDPLGNDTGWASSIWAWQEKTWQSDPPLKNRCTLQQEYQNLCERRTLSYASTASSLWETTLRNMSGSGSVASVSSVRGLIGQMDRDLRPCECVQKLTILAHGGSADYGGFHLGSFAEEPWNVISARDVEGKKRVVSFAMAIAPVMCKSECVINLMACAGGEGQTASIIARLTGCIVRAPARVNGEGLGLIQPQAQGWIDVGEDTYIKEFSPKQGEEPGEILGPRSSTGMW